MTLKKKKQCQRNFFNVFGLCAIRVFWTDVVLLKICKQQTFPFFPHIIMEDPDTIVADPHHFDADADSDLVCHFPADPDTACHVDVIWILHFTLMRTFRIRILAST